MQSKFTRLVFVLILSNCLIINKAVVSFRYAVFSLLPLLLTNFYAHSRQASFLNSPIFILLFNLFKVTLHSLLHYNNVEREYFQTFKQN